MEQSNKEDLYALHFDSRQKVDTKKSYAMLSCSKQSF
jgi:hypothetical protein